MNNDQLSIESFDWCRVLRYTMDIQSVLYACQDRKIQVDDNELREEDEITENFGSEEISLTDSRQSLMESGTTTTALSTCKKNQHSLTSYRMKQKHLLDVQK